MKFLPFDRFLMRTDLSPEEIKAALDENIVNYSFDMSSNCQGLFGGYSLGEDSFLLELIGFRNVAQLEIKATVTKSETGSLIQGKIKLGMMTMLIKTMVFFILGIIALIITADMISSHHIERQGIVIYVMMIGISSLWITDFNNDVSTAKEKLAGIVNGSIVIQ